MKLTLKCYGCKQDFRRDELISYASATSNKAHNYCRKCLIEKQERERFSNAVCKIFGLKVPGPRIWTERKRLQETYGYTDDTIVDCLVYIYNVEKAKKLTESLALVKPPTVEKMLKYKRSKEREQQQLATAAQTEIKEHIVSVKENVKENKNILNADDFLE